MRAVVRRISRLEGGFFPAEDPMSQTVADMLRERRRRRLEASGQPVYESVRPVAVPGGRRLSIAEILRALRQKRFEAHRRATN
jgi:hypothetical protein